MVDDNVDAAKSLARLLARLYGQEVRVAHDGPEALDVAGEFRPEVVLLDIGLPGMDGNEVARRLRERPEFEETLLVALTGWGQESDVERSRAAGFDHHLVKPADPEAILELLNDFESGFGSMTPPRLSASLVRELGLPDELLATELGTGRRRNPHRTGGLRRGSRPWEVTSPRRTRRSSR